MRARISPVLGLRATDADISGFTIQDTAGSITSYTIPPSTHITSHGSLVFKRPQTKILLNNEGDGLQLVIPDGTLGDEVTFGKAPLGQTYNRTSTGWQWSGVTSLPSPAKIGKKNSVKPSLASVASAVNLAKEDADPIEKDPNPWILFFSALGITLLAGTGYTVKTLFFTKQTNL